MSSAISSEREVSTAAEWVSDFARGWSAPTDGDSFADYFEPLLHPDIRLVQPQMPVTEGRRAFRERFARPLFETFDELRATVERWAQDGEVVFIELRFEAKLAGRPLSWRGVDRITLRDGLATERVAYFDPTPLLGAVAGRPRAWPRFARMRMRAVTTKLRAAGR